MTDKVHKIKEWISKTQDGLMDDNGNFEYPEHEGAYDILCNLDAYIDSLQEEPVSEELEAELDKYIKDNFTIDREQLNRFGIEEKDYMYSMDKSDMLKMIRYFTNNYKVPASNDLEEAAKLCVSDSLCITNEEDWDDAAVDALNICKVGAKWQKEQFEKNRLAACDRQTEKEAETERDFVTGIIENEHRQPTFDDAIKYGMRLKEKEMQSTIELAEDHAYFAGRTKTIEEIEEKLLSEVLSCFMHGGEADEVVAKLDEVLNQKK